MMVPTAGAQKPVKVFVDLDGEGMAGIFHVDTQVMPITAPRFQESRRLQIGEVNAAIAGLYDGGAQIVEVADYHSGGNTVSPIEIDKRAIVGPSRNNVMGLDRSYSAYVFVAYHSMAGTERGMIAHGWSWTDYQNIWINGRKVGEVGTRSLLAGMFDIPVIMITGDEAVCKELQSLQTGAECAARGVLAARLGSSRILSDKNAPDRRSADLEAAGNFRFADSCAK